MSNIARGLRLSRPAAATPVVTRHPPRESELKRTVRLLGRFLAGQRRLFVLGALMLIAETVTALLPTLLVGYLVDYMAARVGLLTGHTSAPPLSPLMAVGLPSVVNPDIDTVALVTLGIILFTAVNSLADSLAEIYLARAGRMLGCDLRVALYSHLQRLSLAFYNQQRTGDLLTRVTGDVTALEDFVTISLSDMVGSLLLIAFSLGVMVYKAWQVAIVALLVIPVMALISSYFSRRIKTTTKKQRAREGDLAAAAQQMLTSIRVIQTYGQGGAEDQRFRVQSQKAMDAALEAAGLQARFSWVVSLLESIATAAVIWLGVVLILQAPLVVTVGTLTVLIRYMQDMFKPTKRIIKEWNTVGKIQASVERIGEVLDRAPAVQNASDAVDASPLNGEIEFRHVAFAYQPEPEATHAEGGATPVPRMILKDVSFHAEPGEVVALVGPTGAGKSTILQLLPRLYDPHTGQIIIDGHDIRTFTLESLRAQMSMVLQESILFAGSVADNIAYGRADAPREEVIAAAMQANAHEFIEKLPDGYDTLLGERAANLSGGQRQRIAIARAFIRNTPILILDEPTTGLDAESSDLVLLALRTLMKGKTTLIISHDLNLIRNADKILVVKDGQIMESGTHKELLRAGGVYAELYSRQFGQAMAEQGLLPVAAPAARVPAEATGGEAGDEEQKVLSRQEFGTMLLTALPRPVTPQAFQSLLNEGVEAGPQGATAQGAGHTEETAPHLPGSLSGQETPHLADEATKGSEDAIFHTAIMRVLPRRGIADGHFPAPPDGEEESMSDNKLEAPEAPVSFVTRRDADGDSHREIAQPDAAPPPGIGKAAGGRAFALDEEWVDPLNSPELARELPGLRTAFDPEAMRDYLQAALFGANRSTYEVKRATPGQAIYLPGDCCILRFSLQVEDKVIGRTLEPLVIGRTFPTEEACQEYKRHRLDPLATLMRGREELIPFASPVAVISPLNMVVHVFPIDGQLPTLVSATDRLRVMEILRETLPDALDRSFVLEDCRVERGHYGRLHRCVLRYHVDGLSIPRDEMERRVIYGKVTDDGSGATTGPVVAALRELLANGMSYRFNVPQVYGYRPDLQLLLLEAIPGVPQVARLLGARFRGEQATAGTASLEDMHDACANIAVALHRSGIALGRKRTIDDELAVLRDGFADMSHVSPELAAILRDWLEQTALLAEQTDPLPLCFCHGDYTYTQLIFDGVSSGLVDFDTVCQAEPALDLGQFLAYLRVAVQKAKRNAEVASTTLADELGSRFFDTYAATAGISGGELETLRARTSVYEMISLMRMALHSWQKLKAARIQNVLVVLQERSACLPLASR